MLSFNYLRQTHKSANLKHNLNANHMSMHSQILVMEEGEYTKYSRLSHVAIIDNVLISKNPPCNFFSQLVLIS